MKRKIESILHAWNRQQKPLPFMLIGARQTGKTFILDDFCKKNFEHVVQIFTKTTSVWVECPQA